MADNGVSKKYSIFTNCLAGILGFATNADDKLPFAYIILGMFLVYQAGQGFLDWIDKRKHDRSAA